MTDIQVWINDGIEIESKGHADFNPGGPDIVCAAISALCGTWRECVAGFEAKGYVREMQIKAEEGDFRIYCSPVGDVEHYVLASFATILTGLALLEASYPAYVRLKIHEGGREKSKNDADNL